jgi:hypothetical protein
VKRATYVATGLRACVQQFIDPALNLFDVETAKS